MSPAHYCLCGNDTPLGASLRCTLCGAQYENGRGLDRPQRKGAPSPIDLKPALEHLLLRTWGLFNRAGHLPPSVRFDTLAALREAHAALDAQAGTGPTFPHDRFPETAAEARR